MNKKTSRLNPPTLPDSVIERPEVINAIDAAIKKRIVYIHAPAGFGKTIAMSMWLSAKGLPAAWIPLTAYDDEPAIFCRYLMAALADLDDAAAISVKATLEDPGFTGAPFEYLFRAVSSISGADAQGIIAMDDFHLINNPAILNTLPMIIRKLSQVFTLVIISRLKPPVSLSDFALKNEIGELNENDLRFTKKQIIGLYKNCGITLSHNEAADIEEKTGGWALGLGAELLVIKASGNESFLSRASGEEYIDGYFDREIWSKWNIETQAFLLKTSILEDLTPELCDKLCNCDSERVLAGLMKDSGLTIRLPDGSFRYHHVLRDFLRRKTDERQTELSQLYIMAAQYMHSKNKFSAALDYYVKSGDYGALGNFIVRTLDYSFSKVSAEECLQSFQKLILDKVPAEIMEKTEAFIPICTYVYWITGNTEKMKLWFSKTRDLLLTAHDDQMTGTMLALLTLDPYSTYWETLNIMPIGDIKMETVPSISITINLPYFHRSMRDFSDYLDDWDTLSYQITQSLESVVGSSTKITLLGISCGIAYERNKLAEARQCILAANSLLNDQSHPELCFAVYMHIAEILFADGEETEAWASVSKARAVVEKDALYLKKNLEATVAKYRLYHGDVDAAKRWLSDYVISDSSDMAIYQIPQILSTVRAHITLGAFSPAIILLAKLENLALNCRRTLDRLEALILRAIILWRQRQRGQAIETMSEAVFLAKPCGYIRIFANEGMAVIPILQKLYNSLSRRPEHSDTAVFVRTILLLANERTKTVTGLADILESRLEGKPIKLSKQQMRMLLFLASGKNNRQICEETGMNLNTVKAHLFKLYEKLEVNSATDAVLKAYQLGIIERKQNNPHAQSSSTYLV